jgi:hypothetical protein
MEQRRSSIACTTAAVPTTAGQLVTSERGVCGGPLAFHYTNLMSHTAFRQSLACVSILFQYNFAPSVPAFLVNVLQTAVQAGKPVVRQVTLLFYIRLS